MGSDADPYQKVAGGTTNCTGMSLAGQAHDAARIDTCRDLDGQSFGLAPAVEVQIVITPFDGDLKRNLDLDFDVFAAAGTAF